MTTMMKCGHAAQGVDVGGNPVCVICWPDPRARQPVEAPDLSGRRARCDYYDPYKRRRHGCGWYAARWFSFYPRPADAVPGACCCETDSSIDLPFFEYRPNSEFDRFYCGCAMGWD